MPNGQLYKVSQKQVDFAQAKAIVRLDKRVQRLQQAAKVDSHYIDVAQTITPGNTATLGVLVPVPQGDTEQSRDGDAIALRHIDYRVTFTPHASATTGDSCRFILFRWKAPTLGSAPGASTILSSTTNVDSPYNRDFRESLVVLMDKKFDCSTQNGTRTLRLRKMLNNVATTFNGTASTDWNENAIFFLVLFQENTNKTTMNYYSRVTYSP